MKSGPFLSLISRVYRVEPKTVALYARFLKEAGLMTTGARGVNAPDMLPLDAARITIALLATDSPSQAVERVQHFGQLVLDMKLSHGTEVAAFLSGDGVTFEKALTRLFAAGREDVELWTILPSIEVQENHKRALVQFTEGEGYFLQLDRSDEQLSRDREDLFGIRRSRSLAPIELMDIWTEMWVDRYRGEGDKGFPLRPEDPWNADQTLEERGIVLKDSDADLERQDAEWRKGADWQ